MASTEIYIAVQNFGIIYLAVFINVRFVGLEEANSQAAVLTL